MMWNNKYALDYPVKCIEEFCFDRTVGSRVISRLEYAGINTFADVMKTNPSELSKLRNFGKHSVSLILEFQEKYNNLYDQLVQNKHGVNDGYKDYVDKDTDWEQRRYNLAKEVMLSLIDKDFGSAENIQSVIKEAGDLYKFHSSLAVKYADALIEELRKEE